MVMGLVSGLSSANHSDSESFLVVHALFSQGGCQREGFWEVVGHVGVSFWPFLNSSNWRWLISSVLLTRTSCHKTTYANGYYGAWPGWAVSASVLPLTIWRGAHEALAFSSSGVPLSLILLTHHGQLCVEWENLGVQTVYGRRNL